MTNRFYKSTRNHNNPEALSNKNARKRRIRNTLLRDFFQESVNGRFRPRTMPNKKLKKLLKAIKQEQSNDNE